MNLTLSHLSKQYRRDVWGLRDFDLGLVAAPLANTLEVARVLLVVAWLWPVLLLSGLGSREARRNTGQVVFSALHPILHQLSAAWLAAFSVVALAGAGALPKFLLAGEAGWHPVSSGRSGTAPAIGKRLMKRNSFLFSSCRISLESVALFFDGLTGI